MLNVFIAALVATLSFLQAQQPLPQTERWSGTVDTEYVELKGKNKGKTPPRTVYARTQRPLTIQLDFLDPPNKKTRRFEGKWIEGDCRDKYSADAVHRERSAAIRGTIRGGQMQAQVVELLEGKWAGDINVNLQLLGKQDKKSKEMAGEFLAPGKNRARHGIFRLAKQP